ncbi:MAG: hypothetical protein Q4D19_09615 [Lautropia sp.]|nr:hypothetical protein [Lautropia sp.]
MNHLSPAPLLLVGNSLAVLVAATERAYRGLETTIINPAGPLGGYFAGVTALGRLHDAGMLLYEFQSYTEPATTPSLDSYDPMKRNDVGRFCSVVRRYVHSHQHTQPASMPHMWVDGKLLPDMLLGNNVSAVKSLSNSSAIRREISAIEAQVKIESRLWHPANKTAWPLDGAAPADWMFTEGSKPFNCDTLSLQIHGRTLHESVFASFARQVLNRDASHLAALYHRMPWLPLYWPETLLNAFSGDKPAMMPTTYHYPDQGSVAAFCNQLAVLVRSIPGIQLIEDSIQRVSRTAQHFEVQTARHGTVAAHRMGWAMAPAQGVTLAGGKAAPMNHERLPLILGFIKLPTSSLNHQISVVHAVSGDTGIYRVTNSTHCGAPNDDGFSTLVVEANPNRFNGFHACGTDSDAVQKAMMNDLRTIGLVRENARASAFELRRFDGALPLPTHSAVSNFLADREQLLSLLPGVEPLGSSSGPFAIGLSDQIVQGLQMARRTDSRFDITQEPFVARVRQAEVQMRESLPA